MTTPHPLQESVFITIGAASMCWDPLPTGVFDSQHAIELGNALIQGIDKYVEQRVGHALRLNAIAAGGVAP